MEATLPAEVIRDGYRILTGERAEMVEVGVETTAQLATAGESDQVEFKATLRINLHTGQKDVRMETAVLKTIAAFLNRPKPDIYDSFCHSVSPDSPWCGVV
jgi:hypothetical protein